MKDAHYIRDLMTRASATDFSYNHNNRTFTVGAREVSIADATENPRTLNPQEGDVASNNNTRLASTVLGTVMYPPMYDWLNDNLKTVRDETVGVMIDVFGDLREDIDRKHLIPDTGLFGFSMNRIREKHPHFSLSVVGNCACMGVSVSRMIGQHEWDKKFASFEMHNIDTPEQQVSILAGLGHVAYRSAQNE